VKASPKDLAVGWYLEPPFNNPRKPGFFQTQHWWNEEPWLDCETGERKSIPQEAALYELARRHPKTGLMLCGASVPESGAGKFLLYNARAAWPWLSAEAREIWSELVQPKKGRTGRRLQIISAFEGTEVGRRFKFNPPAKDNFAKWVSAQRRKMPERQKANQIERRAFERVCERAYQSACQLSPAK
jgi:hypothetical protein